MPNRIRTVGSAEHGFTKHSTLVSFVPKKNRAVLLISSMHHTKETDTETGKPEIIAFYNTTKGGVDSLDQKYVTYSTSRRTCRWSMAIFFGILNITSVNAHILYSAFRDNAAIKRFDFMKGLAIQLIQPYLYERLVNTKLPKTLRSSISSILKTPIPAPEEQQENVKRKRCYLGIP